MYVYILLANVNELISFSFPVLVVVACSLLHREPSNTFCLPQKFMTLLSIIVSDMYSLRVSPANVLERGVKIDVSLRVEV